MLRQYSVLQLQEIFRKKNEKKGRKGDAEKSAQLVRVLTRGSVNGFMLKMKNNQNQMSIMAYKCCVTERRSAVWLGADSKVQEIRNFWLGDLGGLG